MDLGKYLKQQRTQADLSQSFVAKKLGYTTAQFISNWERGLSNPPISTLKKLGAMYGIPADELFQVTLKSQVASVTKKLERKFYGKAA